MFWKHTYSAKSPELFCDIPTENLSPEDTKKALDSIKHVIEFGNWDLQKASSDRAKLLELFVKRLMMMERAHCLLMRYSKYLSDFQDPSFSWSKSKITQMGFHRQYRFHRDYGRTYLKKAWKELEKIGEPSELVVLPASVESRADRGLFKQWLREYRCAGAKVCAGKSQCDCPDLSQFIIIA